MNSILLIGFMGSGKSCVGRRLAARLDHAFIDLDAEIQHVAGKSIPRIFAEDGEEKFRQIEAECLQNVLNQSAVIASGGGLVTRPENRAALRDATQQGAHIVYLRARSDTLAARIRRQPGTRPLIDGQNKPLDMQATQARVEELLAQRAGWYEECATLTLDTDFWKADRVVSEIVARLKLT